MTTTPHPDDLPASPSRRALALGGLAALALPSVGLAGPASLKNPRAITMWDFSWLERRYPGGGYEDWPKVLDELVERGYDAVRIDAFPHLIAAGADRPYRLRPWHAPWGAPGPVTVQPMPALVEFVGLCARRGIRVAFSSWFREDDTNVRLRLTTPALFAGAWIDTIRAVEQAGLLDAILYVDLCNEWPASLWAPFLKPALTWGQWPKATARAFMDRALDLVRAAFPNLPLCFSTERGDVEAYLHNDLSRSDLFEHHIWMSDQNDREFIKTVKTEARSKDGYQAEMALAARRIYLDRRAYWDGLQAAKIKRIAAVSEALHKPLGVTEGWALVEYEDYPDIDWGWVKDSCEAGVRAASATGRFALNCTSNFCGPQNVGMWQDVAWHRKVTEIIKTSRLAPDLRGGRLYATL